MGKYDLFLQGIQPRSIVDPTMETETQSSQEARAGPSFDEILLAQLPAGTVNISTDAQTALKAAGIELTPMDLDRIGKGIDRLAKAGGQNGLLIGEKAVLALNVSERSVTAATVREEARDHVFARVDSVMLID